jgi:hypothetical protein
VFFIGRCERNFLELSFIGTSLGPRYSQSSSLRFLRLPKSHDLVRITPFSQRHHHGFELFSPHLARGVTYPPAPSLVPVSPSTLPPTDTDGDGVNDDSNANGQIDADDVVWLFDGL